MYSTKTLFHDTIVETEIEVYSVPNSVFCIIKHKRTGELKIIVGKGDELVERIQIYMAEFIASFAN